MEPKPYPPAALNDLFVLDLAGEIGAYCTKLLADLGARVVHVEPPTGDALRAKGPYYHGQAGPETSLRHFQYNTSKESLTLDLTQAEGAALLRSLAARADVLVEGYPPGYLPGLGLGYDTLAAANPGLIMASITPYGQTGAHRDAAATDLTGVAMGGLLALNGFPEDPPNAPPGLQGYHLASLVAAAGVTMAVCARDFDPEGRGAYLDISMQEAVAISIIQTGSTGFYSIEEYVPRRSGYGTVGGRGRSIYQCGDGKWISFVIPPPFWDNFFAWLAEEDLLGDLAGLQQADPGWFLADMTLIRAAIEQLVLRHDRDTIFHEGQRRRLLVMPVNTVEDLCTDEHLHARGYFVPVQHPALGDTLIYPGAPFVLSETPWRIAHAAPTLGEHTGRILRDDLGLSPAEIEDLERRGIV